MLTYRFQFHKGTIETDTIDNFPFNDTLVLFQSTHPHGVRLLNAEYFDRLSFVSIHAPTRGATFCSQKAVGRLPVSIHAPTRGATWNVRPKIRKRAEVSIHAPTRGATYAVDRPCLWGVVSIHAPTRGATIRQGINESKSRVSIHAPTRGATDIRFKRFTQKTGFNPRTHTGCDAIRQGINESRSRVSIHAPTRGATSL